MNFDITSMQTCLKKDRNRTLQIKINTNFLINYFLHSERHKDYAFTISTTSILFLQKDKLISKSRELTRIPPWKKFMWRMSSPPQSQVWVTDQSCNPAPLENSCTVPILRTTNNWDPSLLKTNDDTWLADSTILE